MKEQVHIEMTSPEGNRTTELGGRPKKNVVLIIAVIVLFVIAAFAAKSFLGAKAAQKQSLVHAQPAPVVVLHTVANTDLAVEREYIGRVEAIQSVSLKPQVNGEIMKVHFKEGSMVKSGQTLFSIDSSQYQATVNLRRAEVEKSEANLNRAAKYFDRLKAADKRSVSKSDLEMAESEVLQGKAAVSQAKASLMLAMIDLRHTRITSPISGRIGAALFTKGNYVSPSAGTLATIVQMDPIRVTFALPDKDYLNQIDKFKKSGKSVHKTTLTLSNGKTLPVEGERDFEDNEIDEKTGTLMMRLRFNNNEGLLIPGSMVRIKTQPLDKRMTLVIPQGAILADSQGDYVFTVGSQNIVQQQRVKLGSEIGTMREVIDGLKKGDNIIVQGLQYVRPGIKVDPTEVSKNESKSPAELAAETEADKDNMAMDVDSADQATEPVKEAD